MWEFVSADSCELRELQRAMHFYISIISLSVVVSNQEKQNKASAKQPNHSLQGVQWETPGHVLCKCDTFWKELMSLAQLDCKPGL